MEFRDLHYFVNVAREGNISRAAEKLIVAQPTLSQSIRKLEKIAGVGLFRRVQHGLALTPEGGRFLAIVEKLLRLKEELDGEMRNIASGDAGRINMGISYTFSQSLVPRVLPVFSKRHPGAEVVIQTETSAVLERMLLDGELDVAVMVETEKNALLAYETLFHEQVLLAIAPQNPLCAAAEEREDEDYPYLPPERLAGQRYILSREKMRLRQSAEMFFRAEGIIPNVAVTTASTSTAIHLAAHGVGVAFVPASNAMHDADPPLPLYFSTADTLADWKVSIVRRKTPRAPPLLKSFIETFKSLM